MFNIAKVASAIGCIVPLLAVACTPARGAGDYKTVRAYNKETGEYFDVKVPYQTHYGLHGRISRDEPSRASIDKAVDGSTWKAESSSFIERYTSGGSASTGSSTSPWQTSSSSGPSPFDTKTQGGGSYHTATSPFSR